MTGVQPQIDFDRVDVWTDQIAHGELGGLRETFGIHSARGPEVVWRPSLDRLRLPQHRFMLSHWMAIKGKHRCPNFRQIDPLQMQPVLGYVCLLDAVEGGRDFRYRVFGSIVAAVLDLDMTSRLVSAHEASPYLVEFYLATYRAVYVSPEPLLTEHGPPYAQHTAMWLRLMLPLVDDHGRVARFVCVSVPVDRNGRPLPA